MIIRNEIPILEYDDSSSEVIPPDHDWTAGKLPEKCFFAFLGDVVHKYAKTHDAIVAETLITVSCDSDNAASRKTILKNGGVLENEIEDTVGLSKCGRIQRYWIPIDNDG